MLVICRVWYETLSHAKQGRATEKAASVLPDLGSAVTSWTDKRPEVLAPRRLTALIALLRAAISDLPCTAERPATTVNGWRGNAG
jgi:hypothetical protein